MNDACDRIIFYIRETKYAFETSTSSSVPARRRTSAGVHHRNLNPIRPVLLQPNITTPRPQSHACRSVPLIAVAQCHCPTLPQKPSKRILQTQARLSYLMPAPHREASSFEPLLNISKLSSPCLRGELRGSPRKHGDLFRGDEIVAVNGIIVFAPTSAASAPNRHPQPSHRMCEDRAQHARMLDCDGNHPAHVSLPRSRPLDAPREHDGSRPDNFGTRRAHDRC